MRPALQSYPKQSQAWKLWVLVGALMAMSLAFDMDEARINAAYEYDMRGGQFPMPESSYPGQWAWDGTRWYEVTE